MEVEVVLDGESELVRLPEAELQLACIVRELKARKYPVTGKRVDYWSSLFDCFVFCGVDPLPDSVVLPPTEAEPRLKLKFSESEWSDGNYIPTDYIKEAQSYQRYHRKDSSQPSTGKKKKERIIGQVIERVTKWRGIQQEYKSRRQEEPNSHEERQTLEDAAKAVGIAKKSLDDYLLMIRFGRRYGFDFQAHQDEKVGVLRRYVKDHNKLKRLLHQSEADFLSGAPRASRLSREICQLIQKVLERCECCRPPACDLRSLFEKFHAVP